MNEQQLKELAELLTKFGFNPLSVEQTVTQLDNSPRGVISIKFNTTVTYSPNLKKE